MRGTTIQGGRAGARCRRTRRRWRQIILQGRRARPYRRSMRSLLLVLGLFGCASELSADGVPEFGAPLEAAPLRVWAADAALASCVDDAAGRLERATGLRVELTDNPDGAVPIFRANRGEWLGARHVDPRTDWLAIDVSTPEWLENTVVLHEVMHALGAGHVASGAGVMSPQIWDAFPITETDLVELCAHAPCRIMVPENSAGGAADSVQQ
jgi:hypothetical protein